MTKKRTKKPKQETGKLSVRITAALKSKLEARAAKNFRTLSDEVKRVLEGAK